MGTASGFSILKGSFDFRQPIEVLMRFIQNLLGDSQLSPWLSNFPFSGVAKGVNISWRIVESPRMIDN